MPTSWRWFFDDAVAPWVKRTYIPDERHREKPFSREDVRFFSKGVRELSEAFSGHFTKPLVRDYFTHSRFRSSYLLYFFPLQAAKFAHLFSIHGGTLQAIAKKTPEKIRILDLGAGPGTASIAFLLSLMDLRTPNGERLPLPPIEIEWWDLSQEIMKDGKVLVEILSTRFPNLRGKVTLLAKKGTWQDAIRANAGKPHTISFFGHVLNEATQGEIMAQATRIKELAVTSQFGALLVEPAEKKSSHALSLLRDLFVDEDPVAIVGPCLHSGRCPLMSGKDWCHFSDPLEIPGQWFREFSIALSNEREWIKYSYLWIKARPKEVAKSKKKENLLLLTDSLLPRSRQPQTGVAPYLACQPDHPLIIELP
ncbi:MAG: small ribosomal subunit Rsm22 family protein, partial [Bdellovibrionota bacterium]